MAIFVISRDGSPLMPTTCYGKVRHMLKDGRAVVKSNNPFTIQLTYETTSYVQPVELCVDTGYVHIGVSAKSSQEEHVAVQYDLLTNEKEMHDAQRKIRRSRRNRKRYRAPRFDNRRASKKKGWLAPSLKNKSDMHLQFIDKYCPSAK